MLSHRKETRHHSYAYYNRLGTNRHTVYGSTYCVICPRSDQPEGETISADTSQTQEASQKKSPNNQPLVFEAEAILGNGQPLPEGFQPESL